MPEPPATRRKTCCLRSACVRLSKLDKAYDATSFKISPRSRSSWANSNGRLVGAPSQHLTASSKETPGLSGARPVYDREGLVSSADDSKNASKAYRGRACSRPLQIQDLSMTLLQDPGRVLPTQKHINMRKEPTDSKQTKAENRCTFDPKGFLVILG